jgi:broad specificity phosphatase PhoE
VGAERAGRRPRLRLSVRVFLLARHGESALNIQHRINGDPSVEVPLTETGRGNAAQLGLQVANLPIDLGVHTRFGRTKETLDLALAGRSVPVVEEPLLDDIDVGDLEGETIDEYRAWKRAHTRSDPFPGGESLDDAARRYVRGALALLALNAERVLVVCHEIPVRYLLNAAGGSPELDRPVHEIPNATPFAFSEERLALAAERIAALVD